MPCQIIKKLCPPGLKNNPNKNLKSIDYVTIHNTGNYAATATAQSHANWLYGGSLEKGVPRQSSWHYTADKDDIYQSFEDNRACWHAANNIGNTESIGIEICVNDKAGFLQACDNAAWLTAELLKKHGLSIDRVVQHNHWSGKNCPAEIRSGTWGVTWTSFLADVKKYLGTNTVQPPTQIVTVDNETVIWSYLKKQGLNDYAVAGLMGNLYAESGLSSINLQNTFEKKLGYTDTAYTTAVDNGSYANFVHDGAGYGLAQWTYWSRKEKLLQYAKHKEKSIGDLQMQLEFLWQELQEYIGVITALKSVTSVRQASDVVLLQYERPADQGDSVKTLRASYGQNYHNKYAGKTVPMTSSIPYTVRVTDPALNIRKGPGTNHNVVGAIRDRGIYTIVEEAAGVGA